MQLVTALGNLLKLAVLWVALMISRGAFWPQVFCDCNSVSPSILIVGFLQCENTQHFKSTTAKRAYTLACTQAVYTSRTADAFTGLQYCVEVVPQPLFFGQERELTQVSTQLKSSYPLFIIFQSKEKRESVMCTLHRSGMLGSKRQPSNHICTPGVSFYTAHG